MQVHVVIIGHWYIYITSQHSGNTALTLSCQREELTIVRTLLMHGANPNVCTQVIDV